ncbi:MAG: type II toxin-antitoxin system RelE/ParE family toxin [Xanthobacteraceae bacterium]
MAEIRPVALRFSARARSQLLAIREYIDQTNPAAAARVGASIREAAEVLRYFPYSGRPGRATGTREWVVRRLPYVLVYEVDIGDEGVTILGIFHCAQKRD